MVLTAEFISKDYQTLVSGIISICLEKVCVPLIRIQGQKDNVRRVSSKFLTNPKPLQHPGNGWVAYYSLHSKGV